MSTVELTSENIERTISNNDMVIVDFWAAWCPPCRSFSPIFETASERIPDVVFGKVDTMQHPDLTDRFGVRAIPTILIFRDHVLVHVGPAALSPQALEDVIARSQALDMDVVRAAMIGDRQVTG